MQRIRLAVRQVGAGVEQEADRARRLACIQNVRPIRLRDAERLASHISSTALLEQIGLLRRKLHPHAAAAARGQDRPAGDGDRAIAVQRIIGGSECQISALDRQGLLSVESIAELGRDLQGQSADSQADILLVCRAAGGDAVLAEGCDGQRPAAAQHNLAACLAFEHGIFRICILRRGIVTV